MTYQEFLKRVQDESGLSSQDEVRRVVSATFGTLRECLAGGNLDSLPQELQQMLPAEMTNAFTAQQPGMATANDSANPQLAGETRAESGGESTAESGQ